VEQLQQVTVGGQLLQRNDGGVGEGGVGLLAHLQQVLGRDVVADELADHGGGDLGIGLAREARDLGFREAGPLGGHVQAAVGGQAGQHRIQEADGRGLAAGRHIAHQGLVLRQSMAA
jgi:hypothetical protein